MSLPRLFDSPNMPQRSLRHWVVSLIILAGGYGLHGNALAQATAHNVIETVSTATGADGKILVKIKLKDAPANPPAGFAINNPPRIAFDFPNTENGLGKNFQEVGDANLRNVNVVQAGDRTRLVLNLSKPLAYDIAINGSTITITLTSQSNVASAGSKAPIVSHFATTKSDLSHSLRDIDFRRGKNGEGRLLIDLSDNTTGIDIRQQGKTLIIDLAKTSVPTNLERRLDVSDFGTPIQTIDTFRQGDNARIVIEPKGLWEHSAYQTDNRFIVEVKPVTEDPNKLTQGGKLGYSGEKLSLNFQNVEVRSVLQVIADFTGLNIITSDTVSGNLTLRLKDVPWDQALDIILQSKGLDMRKNGNVVLIAPRDELATKEKLELESKAQIGDLEPTRTESFQLNYQKADAIQKILSDPNQKLLSKRGSVVVDPRTNILFVQDTAARLEEVRKLIGKIDVPVRQVMIEARIVEANDSFARNLGVRFGSISRGLRQSREGTNVATTGRLEDFSNLFPKSGPSFTQSPENLAVNLPAAGINGAVAGAFALSIANNLTGLLDLELSALQADGKGKIISNPRVLTADNVEATIEQGTEIPYQQATSSGATSVSFRKAVLSLKVKPQITPDGNVIMDLHVNKDSVGATTTAGPSIDTKQITTQALIENGGTIVIGGIYTEDERNTVNKVPLLGDIPFLGFLFKNTAKVENKTELLIFITPRIIKDNITTR